MLVSGSASASGSALAPRGEAHLLNLKLLLIVVRALGNGLALGGARGRILHLHVRHGIGFVIRRCIGSGDVRGRFEAEDGNGRRLRLGGGPSGRDNLRKTRVKVTTKEQTATAWRVTLEAESRVESTG